MTTHGLNSDVVTPTLLNAWTFFGGAFAPAAYWKDSAGHVHIRGLLTSGTAGTDAFVLPVGLRPVYRQVFAVVGNITGSRVDVFPGGNVQPQNTPGAGGFIALDGITFLADA